MDSRDWQRLDGEALARFLIAKEMIEERDLEEWTSKQNSLLKSDFNPKDFEEQRKQKNFEVAEQCRVWTAGIFFWVLLAVALAFFGVIGLKLTTPGSLLDGGPQFTVISLMIALAAYLATVAGKLKEAIKKAASGADYLKYNEDLTALLFGEKLVVSIGCLMTLRPVVRPLIAENTTLTQSLQVIAIDFLDFGVVAFLAGIVAFLVYLHTRQWQEPEPCT
jgi:hypothetical protein